MADASSTKHSRDSWKFPIKVEIKPRLREPSKWVSPLLSFLAVVVALLFGAGVIAMAGGDPWHIYKHIGKSSFGSIGVLSDTMVKAIPLMLTGLACAIAFRMKLWNIGAEGQFFLGAWGASLIVLLPVLPEDAPQWLFILTTALMGMLCGAVWALVPGILKAKFNVNEIISTLMLNYIAVDWNNFFIYAVWSEGGFQMSRMFQRNSWLPRLADYADRVPELRGLTTHFGLVFAVIAAVFLWLILSKSQWGYEIRLIGDNPRAAKYAGISISRNIVIVMVLSGALAGLAGVSEITGVVHRLQGSISPGYGFTAIIIAWLAKLNPFAVLLVSVLFGALILAGREIQPMGVPTMIQGVIMVCLIASDFFLRYRVQITSRTEE